jgi:selT/selW/selH-like putative selenoprotein
MAAEVIQKWPEQVEHVNLHAGVGGSFELSVNGKQIYSKLATKKYPDLEVLTSAITEALAQ